ncbi:MAG: hypothetical protein A2286_13380 [Gammaproteobacteria bacterium RIFOXYA12_FULL_61_12]|nr:MAG: hypothetical protein A2286_13380 [Gammaproteobacteria bacterium RIFOXYA12_FULL_61_12]OGT91198.1 MAG: hypothetical protein A2514_02960 [Gammaproteobacteria bacterium RIFOXYD12_FULL_61_37]
MKKLCIYHADCADGFGAAWVVKAALGEDVGFFPAAYGAAPPYIEGGQDVILVDFSYPRPVLLEMAKKAGSILILDHHASAERELVDLPPHVECVFDMNRSGAMLAWDRFYPSEEPPSLFRYVQDQDLWRFALEGTKEVMATVHSYPYTREAWGRLLMRGIDELRQEGEPIERKQQKDILSHLRACAYRAVIAGHRVPVVNVPPGWCSDAGHILAQNERFAACYWDTGTHRKFSLRSSKDGMDVSMIAGLFVGGGGHKHAAGFELAHSELHKLSDGNRPPLAPVSGA